jgi:hypothetical protein
MSVRIDENGIVAAVQTYNINNRFLHTDISIDRRIKEKVRWFKVKNKVVTCVVVMNLLASMYKNHRLYYSRQKNKKQSTVYNKRGLSNYEICKAIDELEQIGYLINYKASRQYGTTQEDKMSSWIKPTPFFTTEFVTGAESLIQANNAWIGAFMPLIMKDEDKNIVDYRADGLTFAICAVLNRLNTVNSRFVFTDHDGLEFTNYYSRIFNNENFEEGGRFYKANVLNIENKESKNRLRILIDGKPVVEVDYTALHLFILAERKGIADTLGDDPYKRVQGIDRSIVKLAVNTMLNCSSRLQAVQSVNSDIRQLGYKEHSGSEIVSAIFKAFPEFKDDFCYKQCSGLYLQNADSWMTQYVANTMSTLGKPFLPVHDSGLVLAEDKHLLIELMCNAYKEILKVDSIVHMKINYLENNKVVKEDVSC